MSRPVRPRRAGRPRQKRVSPALALALVVVAVALFLLAYLKFGKPQRGPARTPEYLAAQKQFQERLKEFEAQGRVPPVVGMMRNLAQSRRGQAQSRRAGPSPAPAGQ